MSEPTDWKERYFESLEEIESLKKTITADADVLKKGLMRVSLIVDGADEQLDEFLADLRDTLRTKEVRDVDAVITKIEAHLRKQEDKKCKQSSLEAEVFKELLNDLTALNLDRSIRKKLKDFDSQLRKLSPGNQTVSDFLRQYQHLQHMAIQQILVEPSEEKPTFWGGLLSKAKPDQGAPETADETHPVRADMSAQEGDISLSEEEVEDQVRQLQQRYAAIKERVSGVLLAFLDQLNITAGLKPREEKLRACLREGFAWPDFPETLSEGVAILMGSNSESQREFENFLLSLNTRLSDIYDVLEQSKVTNTVQVSSSHAVNDEVKNSITKIRADVDKTQDIKVLKNSIALQLDSISGVMDRYRDEVEVNSGEIFDVVRTLGERMESMEKEANQMRSTIELQRQQSMKDGLTGLANRVAYDEYSLKEISRSQRHGLALSLVVCDIDHFKSINDTYGHLSGDKVLKLVASCVERSVRLSDFVARYGGEEFVILMPETDLESARLAAEKIRAAIESSAFHFKAAPVNVTASFGVAQHLTDEDIEAVFQRADKSLYAAKASGRNCVVANLNDISSADINSRAS